MYYVREVYADEAEADRYTPTQALVSGTSGATGGAQNELAVANTAEVLLTNTLKPFQLIIEKNWKDGELHSLIRPDELLVELWRYTTDENAAEKVNGVALEWVKPETKAADDVWTISVSNLPVYDENGSEYTYFVKEVIPDGYESSGVSNKLPADNYAGNMDDDANAPVLILTNTVTTLERHADKLWHDDNTTDVQHDWTGYRPAQVTLELQYTLTPDNDASWQPAGEAVGVAADRTAQTVNVDQYNGTVVPEGSAHGFSWLNLPTHILDGGTAKPVSYRVVEKNVANGYEDAYVLEGNVVTVDNTLKLIRHPVTKVWVDEDNRYGIRPLELIVTLQSAAEDAPTAWQDVKDSSDKVLTIKLSEANQWSGTFEDLPEVNADGKKLLYRAVEHEVPTGYEYAETDASTLTNTLDSLILSGSKRWSDWDNQYGVRPERITLIVLANGKPLAPQPQITFEVDTADSNVWTYVTAQLPKYVPEMKDGVLTLTEAVYTVKEEYVRGYRTERDTVTTAPGTQQDTLAAEEILNELSCLLEIDNVTANAAHTGLTNAGGFVGIAENGATIRDIDPYVASKLYVSWKNEGEWMHDAGFTVRYQEHGSETFQTITVADIGDLSALRAVYPDAALQVLEDGTRKLTLAKDPSGMPYKTRVEVRFLPTIAVENTTYRDRHGTVAVKDGKYSSSYDGRYVKQTVHGDAHEGMIADTAHLQIGPVGSVNSQYLLNTGAVYINPGKDGSFSCAITLEIAGREETVTVSGKVEVRKRNAYGEPVRIAVTVFDMPACLDIGIPFKLDSIPDNIAQTGDPLYIALGVTGGCGLGLLLLFILNKRKKQKG